VAEELYAPAATDPPQRSPQKRHRSREEQVGPVHSANISSGQKKWPSSHLEEEAALTASGSIKQQIEACIARLKRGDLTEPDLRRIIDGVDSAPRPRQDLLYLQAGSTSVGAPVLGMALVRNGEIVDPPDDPKAWPYHTPLEAIRDGWRVIQFPNLALMMDESRTYGLGCEFILERWSE
jgi:hypothetical protein